MQISKLDLESLNLNLNHLNQLMNSLNFINNQTSNIKLIQAMLSLNEAKQLLINLTQQN